MSVHIPLLYNLYIISVLVERHVRIFQHRLFILGVCLFTAVVVAVGVVVGVVVGVDVVVVFVCAVCFVRRCPSVCTKQHGRQYCCWKKVRK